MPQIIALIIMNLLGLIDNVVGSAFGSKIMQKVNKLSNQLQQTQDLKDDLIAAYNDKNYKLANSILASSPFSGTYSTLFDEQKRIEGVYKDRKQEIDKLQSNIRDAYAKASADSNSSSGIWDLIKNFLPGGQSISMSDALTKPNYDKIIKENEQKINQLIQGGTSSINKQPTKSLAVTDSKIGLKPISNQSK